MAAPGRALLRLALALLPGGLAPACARDAPAGPESGFEDVTAELGLPTAEPRWPAGTYHLPEIMQGGVGLLDHDGDGDLDLFHVRVPPPGDAAQRISNRLYRQRPGGSFEDVTESAGVADPGYGQGVAIGDANNDGHPDVYVTNYGRDTFYANDGDGSFTNRTQPAGFRGGWWSSSAAFGDYDRDGHLDLYVVHYLRYDPGKRCTDPSDRPEYCGPRSFHGAPDTLYRNLGDGSFADVTEEAGIVLPQQAARATGLGVVFLDLTEDGFADVFVANDAHANQLWVNQGDGTFVDQGIPRGVAFDRYGHPEASMGVAVGDVDRDGFFDLLTTHLWEENNRLYLGSAGPLFRDATVASRLSRFDLERTGFGCGFFDFDHDGDLDLAVVNGAMRRRPPLPGAPAGMWADYAEPNQLFENVSGAGGGALFEEVGAGAGPFGAEVQVSRGLAFGDLEGDGDLDLVLSNIDNSLRVYRNAAPDPTTHWLSVRALTGERDALGAIVRLRAGERELRGAVLAAYSYCSSSAPRAHFGLGSVGSLDEIEVLWPDGRRELPGRWRRSGDRPAAGPWAHAVSVTRAPRRLAPRRRLAAGLLALSGASCDGESERAERAAAVPLPSLEHVEPDVVAAIEDARAAVAADPASAEAWGRLADRYFVHDFVNEAAIAYERAEELARDGHVWAYRLALCRIDSDPEGALAPLERSLEGLSEYAPAHEVHAQILARIGREEEALESFARSSELDPSSAHSEAGRGLLHLALGELELARRHLEEALRRDPDHAEAHVGLAQVHLALGQDEEARHHAGLSRTLPPSTRRRDLLAMPSVAPAGARARTHVALRLLRQGKREQAEEQLRRALASNPRFYTARQQLVELLAQTDRRDEAIELLREAQRLAPSFEQVRLDLARLLER